MHIFHPEGRKMPMVFTVVTDGSSEVLASAARALPHEAAARQTTIERVRAGWTRILDSLMG